MAWLFPEGESVFTLAEIVTDLTGFSEQATSIGDVMNTLNTIEIQLASLQQSVADVKQLVTQGVENEDFSNLQSLTPKISTAYSFLNQIGNTRFDLECGLQLGGCLNPQPITAVCAPGTLLEWQGGANGNGSVVYPPGWNPVRQNPTQQECVNLSILIYGYGGLVGLVTGNTSLGGSAATALSFSDLGELYGDAFGGQGSQGLVQATSEAGSAAAAPFYTQAMSDGEQLMDGYMLGQYAELSLVLMANAGYTDTPTSNIQLALNSQPSFTQMQQGMPFALPAGTVIDTMTNLMWDTGIGAIASSNGYNTIAGASGSQTGGASGLGGKIVLEASGPLLGPGYDVDANTTSASVTPITPVSINPGAPAGTPFNDWWAADGTTLNTLYGDACGGCQSPGPTVGQLGGFQSQLMYPGGSGTQVYDPNYYDPYYGPYGASTTYKVGYPPSPVPLLMSRSCSAPCASPGFSAGSQLGLFDFNGGADYVTDPSLPGNQQFAFADNWTGGEWQSCMTKWVAPFTNSGCPSDENRDWPEIWSGLSNPGLPAIFQRPTTAAECYYWPTNPASTPGPSQDDNQPASGVNGCTQGASSASR